MPALCSSSWAHCATSNTSSTAFVPGEGFGWHEHDPNLFEGTERFFRPGYATNLVESWLPALDGVVEKLSAGATVVDVGCGHGSSTILMAQAFPASTFVGTDYHEGSIRVARRRAAEAGVSGNLSFEVADASELAPTAYDLVAMFDCLHDMGDPLSVDYAIRGALREDGTLLLVEPFVNDRLEENLNPIGRVFYGGSTLICTPCSLAQPGARALGPQAGPTVLTNLLRDAGFSRVRVANESPVNLIFEARPQTANSKGIHRHDNRHQQRHQPERCHRIPGCRRSQRLVRR